MNIAGCQIDQLDDAASRRWLDCVLGRGGAPTALGDSAWLLCHCDDGVTWGRRDRDEWRLGASYFPDLCPMPSETNIQELRIFSPTIEVLIWRGDDDLRGRVLTDVASTGSEQPDTPDEEERVLLAARVAEHREGFTRVGDGSGAEQVLPLRLAEGPSSSWARLRVRHYFARDDRTGCVRVVATRLVEVM